MENELVMGTEAYKNGHLIYLAHPAVWYTAEGGITALSSCCRIWRAICWVNAVSVEYYGLSPKNSYIVFIQLDC